MSTLLLTELANKLMALERRPRVWFLHEEDWRAICDQIWAERSDIGWVWKDAGRNAKGEHEMVVCDEKYPEGIILGATAIYPVYERG